MDYLLIDLIMVKIMVVEKDGEFDNLFGVGKLLFKCDDFENVLFNCVMKENGVMFEFVNLFCELVKLC